MGASRPGRRATGVTGLAVARHAGSEEEAEVAALKVVIFGVERALRSASCLADCRARDAEPLVFAVNCIIIYRCMILYVILYYSILIIIVWIDTFPSEHYYKFTT